MLPPDEGLIHAWLDGELDAAQAARVEALVRDDPGWAAAAASARGLIAASERILGALDDVPAGVIPGQRRDTAQSAARDAGTARPHRATGGGTIGLGDADGNARRGTAWWTVRAAAALVIVAGSVTVLQRLGSPGRFIAADRRAEAEAPAATQPADAGKSGDEPTQPVVGTSTTASGGQGRRSAGPDTAREQLPGSQAAAPAREASGMQARTIVPMEAEPGATRDARVMSAPQAPANAGGLAVTIVCFRERPAAPADSAILHRVILVDDSTALPAPPAAGNSLRGDDAGLRATQLRVRHDTLFPDAHSHERFGLRTACPQR